MVYCSKCGIMHINPDKSLKLPLFFVSDEKPLIDISKESDEQKNYVCFKCKSNKHLINQK